MFLFFLSRKERNYAANIWVWLCFFLNHISIEIVKNTLNLKYEMFSSYAILFIMVSNMLIIIIFISISYKIKNIFYSSFVVFRYRKFVIENNNRGMKSRSFCYYYLLVFILVFCAYASNYLFYFIYYIIILSNTTWFIYTSGNDAFADRRRRMTYFILRDIMHEENQ